MRRKPATKLPPRFGWDTDDEVTTDDDEYDDQFGDHFHDQLDDLIANQLRDRPGDPVDELADPAARPPAEPPPYYPPTICTGRRKMSGQIYSSCKTIKSVLMFISCNFVCLNEEGLKFLHREEGATERWIPPVYVSQPFLVSDMPMKALVTVH